MKNWLVAALAVAGVTGVVVSTVDCGNSDSHRLPDPIDRAISMSPTPQPNDAFKKASRVAIKHASDKQSAGISLTPKPTTIEAMLKAVRPDDLAGDISTEAYQFKRAGPFETTNWQVSANITEVVLRSDGDYYLVIEDGRGHRSVVEVPDPKLCADSTKLKEITTARKAIEEKFHPTAQPKKVNVKARVTGLGFFGMARSRDGKKPGNGARIMPGLKVEWL
jgi:hypothetical protein